MKGKNQSGQRRAIHTKSTDPYHNQKQKSKELLKKAREGKIPPTEYLQYYFNIPYRLRKQYGVPQKAPKIQKTKRVCKQ